MKSTFFRALGTFALALVLSATATAQTKQDFSDKKLVAFATAASQVDALIRQWRPRIAGALTSEQATKLREDANTAFVAAIERTKGISVTEYQKINKAARADPKLAARIASLYKPAAKP